MENREKSSSITGHDHTEAISFFPALADRLLRSLDYIAILRPLLLMPVWTMLLLGYYKGLGNNAANRKNNDTFFIF